MDARSQRLGTIPAYPGQLQPQRWKARPAVREEGIPATFYTQFLHTSGTVPQSVRYRTLATMLVTQAVQHMDPLANGLFVQVVRCMPANTHGLIASLRGSIGAGTKPWDYELEQQAIFYGSESPAGLALQTGRMVVENDLQGQEDQLRSLVAVPIARSGTFAGCLLVGSRMPGCFAAEQLFLVQCYADLLPLAFDPADFLEADLFALQPMPERSVQVAVLANFRRKITEMHQQKLVAGSQRASLDSIWKAYEHDLLVMSPYQPLRR